MNDDASDTDTGELPADLEVQASEILLGPPDLVAERFAALCDANPQRRRALSRLRTDFQRAAQLLAGPVPTPWPASIGPYVLRRQLGEGAFGVVFLAEQSAPFRREVALKLLHSTTTSRTAVARFRFERETLARMNHPAIARIHDAGVDDVGRPYFVMEYVPGEPLHHFVATRAADLRERLLLFVAACEGVSHAHQRGVIHRDLKPQNILVADVDGKWLPKVIDFGLAKAVEADIDVVMTHAGAVLGTPAYMSPEQLRGDGRDADVRTDVYALGVILYELLTTTRPIETRRQHVRGLQELQRLVATTVVPLASVRAAAAAIPYWRLLQGDVDWILRRAMAKEPAERYASVAEFAADLRRFLAHEPVSAGPPSSAYLLRKFVRRHRAAVTAAAAVFTTLLLGFVVSAALYRNAHANEVLAREHLANFWRLADVVALDELRAAEKQLWPSSSAMADRHDRWLERAQSLLARRELHANAIATLRARRDQDAATTAEEAAGAGFLLHSLEHHLLALDAFAAEGGIWRDVQRRAEFARTVDARSFADHEPAWARAIDAIAESPRYGGILMRPVQGLVPLGPDPVSGLEEFAHLQSGRLPVRGGDGRLAIGDDTAIVLVLIPGGTPVVGSQNTDPAAPHYDPHRQMIEADVERLSGPPFLLGKYELTQAQVHHLGIAVQALTRAGQETAPNVVVTPRHPEEQVLAPEVMAWLPRFELRLPTNHEWEVAARAGSPSIWGVGDDVVSLRGCANVADKSFADAGMPDRKFDPSLDDGWLGHAPVGTFAPNAFGLHDTLGNVAELATATIRGSKGILVFARGGSHMLPPLECRIGSRRQVAPNQTTPELGVRVARSVPCD